MSEAEAGGARKERLRLWLCLLRTTRFVENALREEMRLAYGHTLPRFDVLASLDRCQEGLQMSELSQQLMVSNGNVTGIVERLVQDGLVERAAVAHDKRATLVRLTAVGRQEFAEMAAAHEGWVDGLLASLTPEDAALVSGRLNEIRNQGDGS
ncbi:MarR family transcriptional regulator [Nisaea sp.]|uniref:MarR family winged helix-turn-helix transcriptional regulator n=1 Tax=Nisaea sp. TaxID=2024842 RepID=UPI003299E7CF